MMIIIQILGAIILAVLILRQPYLGIAFTAASLPLVQALPSIPIFTSLTVVMGGVTLIGYLFQGKDKRDGSFLQFDNVHLWGLLFILWVFMSNPQAALFGIDRNWLFTFIQLFTLTWLTSRLMNTQKKHHTLMWIYSIATLVSAVVVIQNGYIGADIYSTTREKGFVDDPNIAAQYFIVSILFLNYLRTIVNNRIVLLLIIMGITITFLAVFYTASRTGIILIFITLALLILINPSLKYKFQLIIMFTIGLLLIWFLSDNIVSFVQNIVPSITKGTDTVGLRYTLWEIGWRMWLANPLQGVGIGMYRWELFRYGVDLIQTQYITRAVVTHNMYLQVLSETGIVGFTLFTFMLIKSLKNMLDSNNNGSQKKTPLQNVWLIVFLVMALGGITLSSQYNKMIWLTLGISTCFHNLVSIKTQKNTIDKPVRYSNQSFQVHNKR